MRPIALTAAALVLPALAAAGMNRTYLVPAYAACPGGATTCAPQPRASSYTFDQAVLRTPQKPYIAPNQVALDVELKGVRDASGALVTPVTGDPTDDFVFTVPAGRTVLTVGTPLQLEPGSPLLPVTEIRIDLKKGTGRGTLRTPSNTPTSGLVNQTLELPVVRDPAGKLFAVSGARSKP